MDVVIRAGASSEEVNVLDRMHAEVYEGELGLDPTFAASVALQMAELRRTGWPRPGEGLWTAEVGGRVVGTVTLRDVGDRLGRLGHLVLEPAARGHGVGRRLVEHVLVTAREAGYERLELETFSDLSAAIGLYHSVGFQKVSGEQGVRWGREMEWERYELAL